MAIHHFVSHDLDALFLATNAPGRSAYNRVERRMAPLSNQLAGLVLDHEHYGSHLDSQLRTTDGELEKSNFAHAGNTLADVWNELSIDDFPVIAEYIDPEDSELTNVVEKSGEWFASHVRSSQYCLQIVKCRDGTCCKPFRSSLQSVLTDRFMPPPIPLYQSDFGLKAPTPGSSDKRFGSLFVLKTLSLQKVLPTSMLQDTIAFDAFCPTVYKRIKERVCVLCKLYFASNVILKEHKQMHKIKVDPLRVQPKRVLAKRADEALIVTTDEEREWLPIADLKNMPMLTGDDCDDRCPVIPVEVRMSAQWASEDD